MTIYLLGSHHGLAFTALFSTGLNLSSLTFCVKCNTCFSSLHPLLYGVPQDSVLSPLLFMTYTTPLCTLISSLSLYHNLYADDTRLFLSFHPSDFQTSITHFQNALTQITFWMTSKLLSLNSSKTEFLLIGLQRQLAKIHNSSTSILNLLAISTLYLINVKKT